MYLCMATKTISVDVEAYERLRRAKASPRESFSQVIKRAVWPPHQGTAGGLLELSRSFADGPLRLSDAILAELDRAQENDAAAPDRWRESQRA